MRCRPKANDLIDGAERDKALGSYATDGLAA